MARAMVTEYGMSEKLGMINYGGDDNEVFIGRDLAHTRTYGEEVASEIDSEVKRIIDECYAKAKTDHSRSRGCPSFLLCPADGEREDRSG